jgi:hypothetical protein
MKKPPANVLELPLVERAEMALRRPLKKSGKIMRAMGCLFISCVMEK